MMLLSLIGNIGGDPETRYSANGQALLRFNVASNGRAKSQSGEWEDRTEWVRVVVFGNRAETLSQHLRKGMRVYVHGRLEARPWTTQNGELRAGLELAAQDVEFLSPRQQDDSQPSRQSRPTAERDEDDSILPF